MNPDFGLLDNRHTATNDVLNDYIQTRFGGNLLSLRQLEPFIREIRRRFKTLPRRKQLNGEYKTIGGCRNFKSWCLTILKRPDRTVRHMLATANNQHKKLSADKEVTAATLAIQILEYINKKLAKHEHFREEVCSAIAEQLSLKGKQNVIK